MELTAFQNQKRSGEDDVATSVSRSSRALLSCKTSSARTFMFFLSDVITPGGDFCHVDERTVILETREQAFFGALAKTQNGIFTATHPRHSWNRRAVKITRRRARKTRASLTIIILMNLPRISVNFNSDVSDDRHSFLPSA